MTDVAVEPTNDNGYDTELIRRPLYFALGMCLGVCLYYSLSFEPDLFPLIGICSLVLLAGAIVLRISRLSVQFRVLIALLCGAAVGSIVAKAHTAVRPPPVVVQTIGPTMVEGWVTDIEPGENGVRLNIAVHAIAEAVERTQPDRIRLTHTNRLEVQTGRFIRCFAIIRPPPQAEFPGDYPFNRQAFFEGLDGVGYVLGRCRGGSLGMPRDESTRMAAMIGEVRRSVARHVLDRAGERAGGFAAALTSGDRSFMAQSDMEALRNSGLAHLLAISGLHLGIVGSLAFISLKRGLGLWEWFALRVPPQKPAALGGLVATGAYLVLSGASVSTQRAFIMAAIVFLAILLDRSPLSLRTFAIAMIAVIIMQPANVMTPGFQMSFAATGALIASYEAWFRRQAEQGSYRRGAGFVLKSLALTSVIGAAATAPFALFHFDRVAPLGLAANLLAMPIITFVSAPVAGLALVATPLGMSDVFLRIFGWSLERVLAIAHWAAEAGQGGLQAGMAMPTTVLVILVIGLVYACLATSFGKRVAGAVLACSVAIAVWHFSPRPVLHVSRSGDVFVATETGMRRLSFMDGAGLPPLSYADLSNSSDCAVSGCRLSSIAGTVLIGQADWIGQTCDKTVSFLVSAGPAFNACPQSSVIVEWDSIQSNGALTVMQSMTGKLKILRPTCDNRPWTPCLN